MGFKIFGDDRDNRDVLAVNSKEEVLSSLIRQDDLFQHGYQFEAALARAALVEGLLLAYLLTVKQVHLKAFDLQTERRLQAQRITLGQTNLALKRASAFHDPQLGADVSNFVRRRNQVAHELVVGMVRDDVKEFFEDGGSIAGRLWTHILNETKAHRNANP